MASRNRASRRTSPRLRARKAEVAAAQLAADRAPRGPADAAETRLPGEALEVAAAHAPDVCPDDERFEGPGPDDRLRVGDHRAHEAREGVTNLGHGDRDLALGGLDPPGARAVARARGLGGPLVAGSPQEDRHSSSN